MRRYGQHFLTDTAIVAKMVVGAEIGKNDDILEIGSGRGILTRALAAAAKKVVTIEIDRRLHRLLTEDGLPPNVELLRGSVLDMTDDDLEKQLGMEWKLVANLPYEITSKTLERFLPMRASTGKGPTSLTLMLQKEVGERIVAQPGAISRLSLFCGYYAAARILFSVPAGAFSPPPDVDSCVVHFSVQEAMALSASQEAAFFRLLAAAFSEKRRQLKNSLGMLLGAGVSAKLEAAGILPEARPEEIPLQKWITLASQM